MRVLAAQIDPVELAPEENLARAVAILDRAADVDADLLVLPETWTTGYDLPAARRLVDRSEAVLNLLAGAARSAGVAVVGSMVLSTPTGAANAAVMIDAQGDVALRYAKSHLIDLYGEKSIFEAGRATPTVEIAGTRLGVAICYDLRFPELFRAYVDEGAEVLVVVAEWPAERAAHWELLLRARAVENQAWVVGVNRVGSDRSTTYAGRSQVIGPTGDVVAAAASDVESELVVDLDLDEVRQLRARFPVLADRWLGVRERRKA
jgi:predicted amidohydrolase